jgi:hypothetical protein
MGELVAQSHQKRLEAGVREWLQLDGEDSSNATNGDSIVALIDTLRDGVSLCAAANRVRAGAVARVNSPATLPFKQMENVSNALSAFKALGVPSTALFAAADLATAASGNAYMRERVLASLDAIRRHLTTNATSTSASDASLVVPSTPAAVPVAVSLSSRIRPSSPSPSSPSNSNSGGGGGGGGGSSSTHGSAVATSTAVHLSPAASSLRSASGSSVSSSPLATMSSSSSNAAAASTSSVRHTADVSSLNADVETAKEFKYNPETERKVRAWVEAVLKAPLPDDDFHLALKSGVVLCRLFGALHPEQPKLDKIYDGKVAYLQMQNISLYIKSCESVGMRKIDLFDTIDLFDKKNMNAVLNHLITMASRCAKRPGYSGPALEDVKGDRSLFSQSLVTDSTNAPFRVDGDESELTHGDRNMLKWIQTTVDQSASLFGATGATVAGDATRVRHWFDLRSGVVLLRLLERLCDANMGFYHQQPTLLWHAMQNASLVLRAVEQHTNNVVSGCSARDIVQGERSGLLALVRFLRVQYDMAYLFQCKLLAGRALEGDALDDAIATALESEPLDDDEDEDDGATDAAEAAEAAEAERLRRELLAERQELERAEEQLELERRESVASLVIAKSQPASAVGTPARRTSTRAPQSPLHAPLLSEKLAELETAATKEDQFDGEPVRRARPTNKVPFVPTGARVYLPPDADEDANAAESDDDEASDDAKTATDSGKTTKKHRKSRDSSGSSGKTKKVRTKKTKTGKSSRTKSGAKERPTASAATANDEPVEVAAVLQANIDRIDDTTATIRAKRQAVEEKLTAMSRPPSVAPSPAHGVMARTQRSKKLTPSKKAVPVGEQGEVSAAYAAVRQQVARELLQTERSYVASLARVCDELLTPLNDLLARNEPILIGNEIEQIFSNVADLRARHTTFLAALEPLVAGWSESTALGAWLDAQLRFLEEYAPYLRNYEMAQVHLHIGRRSRPEFGELLERFEGGGMAVGSLLVMPVQRIPRYVLLLDNMCKYTVAEHADAAPLKAVRASIRDRLAALNSGIDRSSVAIDATAVMRIERAVGGVDTLVSIGRRFICDGRLRLKSIERLVSGLDSKQLSLSLVVLGREKPKLVKQQLWILFSDVFVLTEHHHADATTCLAPLSDDGKTPFTYIAHLPLSSVTHFGRPTPNSKLDRAFGFSIYTQMEKLVFKANSAVERDNWLSALKPLAQPSATVVQDGGADD